MLRRTEVAGELARRAGRLIREAMGDHGRVDYKSAVDLVTDIDRRAQQLIVDGLHEAFPVDAVVAEEGDAHGAPDAAFWCIDPLDGTTNFVHALPHFAVSIAFLEERRPTSAAVYDPCRDELFLAERGAGAWLGERRLRTSAVAELDKALLVTGFPYDRRQKHEFYLGYFREFLCRAQDVRRYGSASLDLCYVAAGRFDGFWEWYLHPWDTAAGWLVVEEAGGSVSDFDGSAYDAWTPRILATNGPLHEEALTVLAGLPRDLPED